MPVTLGKMAANTASVTIPIGTDTLTIVYYPNAVTDNSVAQFDAGSDAFNETMPKIIKSWDIYVDEEQTTILPIAPESFADMGYQYKLQILQAIIEDVRPNTIAPQIQN
jgi:hypothetical protein